MAEIAGLADGQVERHRGVGVPIRGHGELAAQHEVGVTLAPVGERADLLPAGIVRIRADGRRAHRAGQFQIAERPNGALATVDKRLHRLDALGDLLGGPTHIMDHGAGSFWCGCLESKVQGQMLCMARITSQASGMSRVAIMSAPVPSTLATMTWPICTGAVVSTACSRRRDFDHGVLGDRRTGADRQPLARAIADGYGGGDGALRRGVFLDGVLLAALAGKAAHSTIAPAASSSTSSRQPSGQPMHR